MSRKRRRDTIEKEAYLPKDRQTERVGYSVFEPLEGYRKGGGRGGGGADRKTW